MAAGLLLGQIGDVQTINGVLPDETGNIEITTQTINAIPNEAGSVTTNNIASGNVTEDKIAGDSISSGKIKNGAITKGKIQNGAVSIVAHINIEGQDWTSGPSGYYKTFTAGLESFRSNDKVIADVDFTWVDNLEDKQAYTEAWSTINEIQVGDGSITVYADDIPKFCPVKLLSIGR